MAPFDCYKTYLALKNHFTKDSYDYHKYCKKTRASLQTFYRRKDRFWFEKVSRNKDDKEVEEFFVSNFITSTDPSKLWIGEIIREGEVVYTEWKKRTQSLSYIFKEETENLFDNRKVDDVFDCSRGHPLVLKQYLNGSISLETLVIYNQIFSFGNDYDKKLKDPVWETVSLKIKKYSPFLHIDVFRYRKILKQVVLGES
jgi:hypothetical protein